MKLNRSKSQGFTLLELLVVVGLIGLLTMFAVPAFNALGQGQKLRSAAFQLNTALSLARQQAITTRQDVYVLFPDDEASLYRSPNQAHVEKAFRGYAIYGERDGYLSDWTVLPPGVVFDPEFERGSYENFFNQGPNRYILEDLPFPDNDSARVELFGVGFRSDGPMHLGGVIDPTIFITEGWTEFNPENGAFESWNESRGLRVMAVRVHAVTGQTKLQEFEP
jgi:prepilin-type N-terminal cleavage/methylation domain-containing protein